jgi:hypothetical protein
MAGDFFGVRNSPRNEMDAFCFRKQIHPSQKPPEDEAFSIQANGSSFSFER